MFWNNDTNINDAIAELVNHSRKIKKVVESLAMKEKTEKLFVHTRLTLVVVGGGNQVVVGNASLTIQ